MPNPLALFHSHGFGTRSRVAALVLLGLGLVVWLRAGSQRPEDVAPTEFYYHHDHILGTSLDLVVVAGSPEQAESFEKGVLDEIERLRVILSTYDSTSEISRLNSATRPMPCSPELIDVLRKYEEWTTRSGGALNGQLETLIATWKDAEKRGIEPDSETLAGIVAQIQEPGWRIDEQARTVTRLTSQALNVNAIGRGYILGKAAAAGRARVPAVRGYLLDIGGDMAAWSDNPDGPGWQVGVANPSGAQDNAPPLTRLRLPNGAVATSGPYQRFYTFGDKRYSHIFDPRTGRPAEGIASATVMAPDTVTANALATTLCVLAPEEGLRLAGSLQGVECLLIMADGRQMRTPGLKGLESPLAQARAVLAQANPWPKDFQVTVTLTLSKPANTNRYRRPYVAVWLENDQGKSVRTLSVWGKQPRYYQDLSYWWKFAQGDRNLIMSVTRATRPPGQYQLLWDGTDDQGNPVPQGTYTAVIEVHREHGKHVRQMGAIKCGSEITSVNLAKTLETEEAKVEFGPKGK